MEKTIKNEVNKLLNKKEKITKKIKNLVLAGGGVKGIAHLGALQYLYINHLLDDIENYLGVSVGGLILFFIVLGYTPKELFEYIKKKEIKTNISIKNFFIKYGCNNYNEINKMIKEVMDIKNIGYDITFEELNIITNKTLILPTVNINTSLIVYLSHLTVPKMKILDGLRMTTSIPLYFEPVLYEGSYYIDGGVLNNFPIDYFKDNTLGICFKVSEQNKKINNIKEYIQQIIGVITDTNSSNNENVIVIKIDNVIMPISFKIDIKIRRKLYKCGYKSAKLFINS